MTRCEDQLHWTNPRLSRFARVVRSAPARIDHVVTERFAQMKVSSVANGFSTRPMSFLPRYRVPEVTRSLLVLIRAWLELLERDEHRAWGIVRARLTQGIRRFLYDAQETDREDLVQKIILGWWASDPPKHLTWPAEANLFAWIRSIARLASLQWRRSESAASGHRCLPLPSDTMEPSSSDEDDLLSEIVDISRQLPPPHGWILGMRLSGLTRKQIEAKLQILRNVGPDEIRRLCRDTMSMTRTLLENPRTDLKSIWPSKFGPKKNPWWTSPPPD